MHQYLLTVGAVPAVLSVRHPRCPVLEEASLRACLCACLYPPYFTVANSTGQGQSSALEQGCKKEGTTVDLWYSPVKLSSFSATQLIYVLALHDAAFPLWHDRHNQLGEQFGAMSRMSAANSA